jgi:hypothetical protein
VRNYLLKSVIHSGLVWSFFQGGLKDFEDIILNEESEFLELFTFVAEA